MINGTKFDLAKYRIKKSQESKAIALQLQNLVAAEQSSANLFQFWQFAFML